MSDVATSGSVTRYTEIRLPLVGTFSRVDSHCDSSSADCVDRHAFENVTPYDPLDEYIHNFQAYEKIALGHGFSDSKTAIRYYTNRMKKQLKELDKRLPM
jgi:hypothetical protein